MGQGDILDFLKENPDFWFDSKKIGEVLGISSLGSVNRCLRLLYGQRLIKKEFLYVSDLRAISIYKYKGDVN